uniref:EGF-like domain-containing protein n=1 Tax=Aplanochytrium stocchinoi TaxID=215587 RepID=A0A7S3V0N9_9STRA|mmetsp:Transcript_10032/g.12519  ORF Transcript_10032/g.12519 Transcript_10032/m.12519 type:complete len:421 (-) Transcript_10032:515-1777(-)
MKSKVVLFHLLSSVLLLSCVVNLAAASCDTFDYTFYGELDLIHGNCSGRGDCVAAKCVCDDGWTGLSDLINTDGTDCQINIAAVKALWGVNVFYATFALYKSLPYVKARWDSFQLKRQQKRAIGKTHSIWDARILVACLAHLFICVPSNIALAVLRWTKEDERVGITFASSLFFATGKIGFYTAVYFYSPTLVEMTLKDGGDALNRSKLKSLVNKVRAVNLALMFTSFLVGFLPFITYADGGELNGTAEIVYLTYFVGMVVTIIFNASQSLVSKLKIERLLDRSYAVSKDERLRIMKAKIATMQNSAISNGYVQTLIYMLFIVVPFLYNKHDYFLPISWITYLILGKKMYMATVKDDPSKSASKGKYNMKSGKGAGTTKASNDNDNDNSDFEMTHNPQLTTTRVMSQTKAQSKESNDSWI